ncbi:MAG: signal peptidase I [Calditrichaeota bacterium]|nr:MAG: signal peptidase I [Calditrichota bacterium]
MKAVHKKLETVQALLIALLAALILRQFVIAAYKIPTSSMEDTLLVGDFLLVNKFVYGAATPSWIGIPFTKIGVNIPWVRLPAITEPKPYDVVVFKYPLDPSMDYIKRCIAVGGQTVLIKNKVVYVDGKRFPDPPHLKFADPFGRSRYGYTLFRPGLGDRDNFGPLKVPEGHYFMMGDNRDYSSDSRQWGFVPEQNLVGKPLIVYLSWDSRTPDLGLWQKIRWNRLALVVR